MDLVLTMKLKKGKAFEVIPMPPFKEISAGALKSWIGKPCVLECATENGKVYAYGNESVRGSWEKGKCVMDMESFCNYWRYKILEYGIDLFTQQENREHGLAQRTQDGDVTDQQAHEQMDLMPHKYGTPSTR